MAIIVRSYPTESSGLNEIRNADVRWNSHKIVHKISKVHIRDEIMKIIEHSCNTSATLLFSLRKLIRILYPNFTTRF